MIDIETQQIVENYKYYMEEILKELKEYDDRIKQQEGIGRYIKFTDDIILCGIADYCYKDLASSLRRILENLAFAIMEANVESYKEKDKTEKANSKVRFEIANSAKKIIEKISYFNYQCLPVAIEQEQPSPIITPLSGLVRKMKVKLCMTKEDFKVFYDVLSEGDNNNRIHAKNKNNKTTLYDKIFSKERQNIYNAYIKNTSTNENLKKLTYFEKYYLKNCKLENIQPSEMEIKLATCVMTIYRYITNLLKHHCVRITKITKEQFDNYNANKKRKTDIVLDNVIECRLDFVNYKVISCAMNCTQDANENTYHL